MYHLVLYFVVVSHINFKLIWIILRGTKQIWSFILPENEHNVYTLDFLLCIVEGDSNYQLKISMYYEGDIVRHVL